MDWFFIGLLAFCAPLLFLIMLLIVRSQVSSLRRRVEALEQQLAEGQPAAAPRQSAKLREVVAEPEPEPETPPARIAAKARRTATVTTSAAPPAQPRTDAETTKAQASPPPAPPRPPKPERPPLNFEELIGGKLPIWVGGIALVFAGFFLVRYTIEAGLFGPVARCITATIFAFILIAFSEFGGRLPKIGEAFKADPRVGQATAGAGVAVLYGTLYMAVEIYSLLGFGTAFVAVVAVTALALVLSLRHGPPTALMGVAGGFAAPWVAGMGAHNLSSLLLYLTVFIAALFGLAIWRRWLWLLLLASGGGALWTFALLETADSQLGLLGGFILICGVAGLLAIQYFPSTYTPTTDSPVTGASTQRQVDLSAFARYLPATLALIQLAILIPRLEFSATGWLFYAALSILSVVRAWRDKSLIPLVGAAMLIGLAPIGGAWSSDGATTATLMATLGFVALFAGAGHVKGRSGDGANGWALIALATPVAAWFTALISNMAAFEDMPWGVAAMIAALSSAWIAWDRHQREDTNEPMQVAATAATALMAAIGLNLLITNEWFAAILAVVALGVAAWAKRTGMARLERLALVPLGLSIIGVVYSCYNLFRALGDSLAGEQLFYSYLPTVGEAVPDLLVPVALIALLAWQPLFAIGQTTRRIVYIVAGAGLAAFIWLIAKQISAIETPADFIRLGFAERMAFTQAFFLAGWLALREAPKHPAWPSLKFVGLAATGIAAFRFIWFDLLVLNPVFVPQALGSAPIANLGTIHAALAAVWLWLASKTFEKPAWRQGLAIASLGASVIAVLVTVRQLVHGSLINGTYIETSENYLYSAALMGLAIAWLARGLMLDREQLRAKLLRVAGLALLTAVTFKVFLIDAAALTGVLRILSFLGLGIALIGIGWAYGRIMGAGRKVGAEA